MKNNFIKIVLISTLTIPAFGFSNGLQEHPHNQQGRSPYEERQERYRTRMYWQMPRRILDELGVKPGMTVADVGAGIGYFSMILAERLAEGGSVLASDIDSGALSFLDERRKKAGYDNITIIHGEADNPHLPEASADLILMVNTIHLVKDKKLFLNNLRTGLKKGGRVVFVQWDAEKMDTELPGWSIDDREKYTQRTMLRTIYDAGYDVLRIMNFLPMQRIYICQPATGTE